MDLLDTHLVSELGKLRAGRADPGIAAVVDQVGAGSGNSLLQQLQGGWGQSQGRLRPHRAARG